VANANAWLSKAEESLASAQADFDAGRFNSCARGTYYACFQAAVAALITEDVVAPRWGHAYVQAQFSGVLIRRRKRYPTGLREALPLALQLRLRADYQEASVSQRLAGRQLEQARNIVGSVKEQIHGNR
jgi:uncharacterized protein (UPF0332 family)